MILTVINAQNSSKITEAQVDLTTNSSINLIVNYYYVLNATSILNATGNVQPKDVTFQKLKEKDNRINESLYCENVIKVETEKANAKAEETKTSRILNSMNYPNLNLKNDIRIIINRILQNELMTTDTTTTVNTETTTNLVTDDTETVDTTTTITEVVVNDVTDTAVTSTDAATTNTATTTETETTTTTDSITTTTTTATTDTGTTTTTTDTTTTTANTTSSDSTKAIVSEPLAICNNISDCKYLKKYIILIDANFHCLNIINEKIGPYFVIIGGLILFANGK